MTINAVTKGIQGQFYASLATLPVNTLDALAEAVKSQSNTENYFIAQDLPGFQELIDEVKFDEISDYKISIDNKDYYGAVREDRNRIEDSKEYLNANIDNQLRGITKSWGGANSKLIGVLLNAGDSTTKGVGFDGANFFSATKNFDTGSNVIQNLTTGTGITAATFEVDFAAAKTLLYGFKSRSGEPFNANPKLVVVVPPLLEDVANKILGARMDLVATTGTLKSNIYAGAADIVVNWAASTDNSWYIVNINNPMKPIIIQDRQEPLFYFEDDNKKKYVDFFYKARKGSGFGSPLGIVKIKTT